MGRTRTKAADAKADEQLDREMQALQLRKAGASYRTIGRQLGISHEQARRDVEQALSYIRDDVAQDARKLRDLELARLDDNLLKVQDYIQGERVLVRDGNGNPILKPDGSDYVYEVRRFAPATVLAAIDRMLKISERRARLLGLDMPVKYEEVTWQSEILTLLREGKITREQVEQELGADLATEFFKSTGLPVTTTR